MAILLDSVILIDHLNGIALASEYIRQCGSSAAVSIITRAEVLVGDASPVPPQVLALLDSFSLFTIDSDVADLAAGGRVANVVRSWARPGKRVRCARSAT